MSASIPRDIYRWSFQTILVNVNSTFTSSLYAVARSRLSSVTFVHPTQLVEIFGNVSTPFGNLTSKQNFTEIVRPQDWINTLLLIFNTYSRYVSCLQWIRWRYWTQQWTSEASQAQVSCEEHEKGFCASHSVSSAVALFRKLWLRYMLTLLSLFTN